MTSIKEGKDSNSPRQSYHGGKHLAQAGRHGEGSTAIDMGLHDRTDPYRSIEATVRYLQDLKRRRGDDYILAYNAGPERVRQWRRGNAVLKEEQKNYVPNNNKKRDRWQKYIEENFGDN